MSKLSPAAQELVRTLFSLKTAWDQMQLGVQEKLLTGIAAPIKQLADNYIPILGTAMGTVATAFNQAGKEALAFLNNADVVADLKVAFDLVAQGVANAAGAIAPLVRAFTDLFIVGSEFMPALGNQIAFVADKFAAFIATARNNGDLKRWIQEGIDTLKLLGEIAGNVFSIFTGLFSAADADGKGFLTTLRDLTAQMLAWVQSAEGQETIGQVFEGLRELGGAVLSALGTVATVVGAIVVAFGKLPTPVQDLIANFLVWGAIVGKLVGPIGGLVKALGTIPAVAKAVVSGFGLVSTAFRAMSVLLMTNPWVAIALTVVALVVLIVTNWDTIVAFLTTTWEFIKTTAETVWNAIVGFFTGIWTGIVAEVQREWAIITSFLTTAWTTIQTVASTVWGAISGFFTGLWTGIVAAFQGAWDAITTALTTAWTFISTTAQTTWDTVTSGVSNLVSSVVGFFTNLVSTVVGAVTGFVGNVISFFANLGSTVLANVGSFVSSVISSWQNFLTTVSGAVSGFVGQVISFFSNLASTVLSNIGSFITNVVNFFVNLPGQVLGALGNWFNQMVGLGGNVIQGLLNGIQNGAQQVINYLVSLASQALDAVKSFFGIASPSKVFADIGKNLGLGMAQGVDKITPTVEKATEKMSEAAVDAVDVSGAGVAAQRILDQLDPTSVRGGDGSAIGKYIADTVAAQVGDITIPAASAPRASIDASVDASQRLTADLAPASDLDTMIALLQDIRDELAAGQGGLTVNQQIHPDAVVTADEANQQLRTMSALGVFSR
jgi:phage-related protein